MKLNNFDRLDIEMKKFNITCQHCKNLRIWVKCQGEENQENVYCCNWMECQDIKNDYCSHFSYKDVKHEKD
jgi:hypothetical protein